MNTVGRLRALDLAVGTNEAFMFKVMSTLTFPWPVKVIEPDLSDAGALVEHTFTARFKILPPERIKASNAKRLAILEKTKTETALRKLKQIQAELEAHDRAAVFEVLAGWDEDLVDQDEKPIPFTEANFNAIYAHARVRSAFGRAYEEAISEDKARLKN